MRRIAFFLISVVSLAAGLRATSANAGDWPQWRYDAQRSAASPDDLPKRLKQAWVRQLPVLKPAWPDQEKMQFDRAYEPIVVGQRLFVGSSYDDSVTAFDTTTGDELWRFYAGGPVRFAPVAWQDKLYFTSDDGHLYCLKSSDGSIVWRFRGGPSDRKVLGNERLISTWPARGAPVVADGRVYFAAGIWPFMGIFLHALDAASGEVVWTNDGDGSRYMKQPHNSDSFAGVAPQGPLVAVGNKLLVPGGRSVPACYDRENGKLLYYQLAENGKKGGGSSVAATTKLILNGGAMFDLANEQHLASSGSLLSFAGDTLYDYDDEELRALDLRTGGFVAKESIDRKGEKVRENVWEMATVAEIDTPEFTSMITAGSRLYAGEDNRVVAYDLPLRKDTKIVWEAAIAGTPTTLLAADNKLFAVTLEGKLYAFSSESDERQVQETTVSAPTIDRTAIDSKLPTVVKESGTQEGYVLVVGAGDVDGILDVVRSSDLRLIVIEPDAKLSASLRQSLHVAGIGAEQVAVLDVDPLHCELPPYFASLIVALDVPEKDCFPLMANLLPSLRPFGGAFCLDASQQQSEELVASDVLKSYNAVVKQTGEFSRIVREGPLPGSANWTHEHGNAANTRVSRDALVKAPLGLLWFGGASHDAILPRHGHGPQPQVVDGRLFIEGLDVLRATDIYTGRLLWEAKLPGLGKLYNNTSHQPGANAVGTNYIATSDGVYVAHETKCLKLNPATGELQSEFQLPVLTGETTAPTWSYLNIDGDYLIGGAEPLVEAGFGKITGDNDNFSSSKRLTVMNRSSGKVLWTAEAKSGFRHNAICIGGGRLYCIDRLSGAQVDRLKRRGEDPETPANLIVFDLETGTRVWTTKKDVFGTWLSYSEERDVLIEAGRTARDTLSDEPKGMRAYNATSGDILWHSSKHVGPAMIHHDTILMAGNACDLLTGELRLREHPLTGEPVEWRWSRNYGCDTPMASEHLLTFRSGTAGYLDYCNDGGTGNFGGFRSSCTNNLVVAGGLLNAPDYTRTCTCSYQNQTSLALVPMPEVETWTSIGKQSYKRRIRSLGVNLGAPGDRKSENGTVWVDFPSVGGDSPEVAIAIAPKQVTWFRRHSASVKESDVPWVAASGGEGISSLRLTLADKKDPPRKYTVRLYFMEPEQLDEGDRAFDIHLQSKPVEQALDIVKQAGGPMRGLIKEFTGVECRDTLVIELLPQPTAKKTAVLSGVEIQAEGW